MIYPRAFYLSESDVVAVSTNDGSFSGIVFYRPEKPTLTIAGPVSLHELKAALAHATNSETSVSDFKKDILFAARDILSGLRYENTIDKDAALQACDFIRKQLEKI